MENNINDVIWVKKVLCQQLQLLAEISKGGCSLSDSIAISETMCNIAKVLFMEVD